MAETLEVLLGEELNKVEVRMPQALLAIADGIDKINAKPISLKGLTEMAAAAKDLQGQLSAIYDTITEEQQKAALALQRLAKANKDNADATIKNNKAENERLKGVVLQAKADEVAAKTAEAKARSEAAAADAKGKSTKAIAAQEKELSKINNELTNDYALLSKAYNDAALRAKNYSLQLGETNPVTLQAIASAKKMDDTLKRLDASVGQHQREVGHYAQAYNGLNVSIQQILRETPAAAVSLNTFFLAISNNLPMLFDEIAKIRTETTAVRVALEAEAAAAGLAAKENAILAGATESAAVAEGELAEATILANGAQQKAPTLLQQIGKSLFSVNSLLTAGVLFLTLYGGKIIDWIGSLLGADATLKLYTKSLEEENKKIAENTLKLTENKDIINDNSRSLTEKTIALSNIQEQYKGYLEGLSIEKSSITEINEAIDTQIQLLSAQAEAKANAKVAEDAQLKLIEAIQNSEAPISRASALWAGYKQIFKESAEDMNLSKDQLAQYNYLLDNVSRGAAYVYLQRIRDTREAQDELTKATQYALKPKQRQIDLLLDEKKGLDDEISLIQRRQMVGYEMTDGLKAEIHQRQLRINVINDNISALQNEQDVLSRHPNYTLDKDQFALLIQQNRTLASRKGTKDRLENEKKEVDAQLAIDRNKLQLQYGTNDKLYQNNFEYQQKDLNLLRKAEEKKSDLEDSYNNKNKPKRQRIDKDPVNEIVAAQKRLTDAERDADVERLNQSIANNDLIFQNEKTSEDKRAAAYAEMFDARLEIARINRDKEIQDVNDWLSLRQNEIDKANNTEKSKQTEHQQALLIDEEAMFTRRRAAEMKYRADVADINRDSLQGVQKLVADFDDKALTREQKQAKDDLDITARYFKNKKDYYKTQADEEKKYWQDTARNIEYGALAIDTLTKLYDIQSKKRIDQIDAQKTALDSQLQTEIDAINATTDSEEVKQQKIKDAQGQTAAAKKQLDDEERKRKIAQAKTDKALGILQIILNTAAAVTKLLYAPPLAIAAGIAGAAQLAIAVATPIPQYAKGVEYKPTNGLMYVGDGGEKELIEHPDGRMEWSKDTATLMYGAKGTRVTPESVLIKSIYNGQSSLDSGSLPGYSDFLAQQLIKSNRNVVAAIKNMPRVSVNIDKHGYNMSHQEGNAYTTYINRKINH